MEINLKKKGKANALVLSCIDPRYISFTTDFLNDLKELHNDYDLFVLAGSELGALSNSNWNKTFSEHIDIAISLHNIKKIICVSHMDCGMYKQHYDMKKDNDIHLHHKNQLELKDKLKVDYPSLKYASYILTDKGEFIKSS